MVFSMTFELVPFADGHTPESDSDNDFNGGEDTDDVRSSEDDWWVRSVKSGETIKTIFLKFFPKAKNGVTIPMSIHQASSLKKKALKMKECECECESALCPCGDCFFCGLTEVYELSTDKDTITVTASW